MLRLDRSRGKLVSDHEHAEAPSALVDPVRAAYLVELRSYRGAREFGEWVAAWHHLERAHILAQPRFGLHLASHSEMLKFAFLRRDMREVAGQLLRIALVPLGALTRQLPMGNTGRARVSAFAPMPVPADLRTYLLRDAS